MRRAREAARSNVRDPNLNRPESAPGAAAPDAYEPYLGTSLTLVVGITDLNWSHVTYHRGGTKESRWAYPIERNPLSRAPDATVRYRDVSNGRRRYPPSSPLGIAPDALQQKGTIRVEVQVRDNPSQMQGHGGWDRTPDSHRGVATFDVAPGLLQITVSKPGFLDSVADVNVAAGREQT